MTWFASESLHEQSPVIERLLAARARDSVLLFCRLPAEPYVCCGRLGLSAHNVRKRPIPFVWNLLDAETLVAQSTAFREILSST